MVPSRLITLAILVSLALETLYFSSDIAFDIPSRG